MQDLPIEILSHIFSYLNYSSRREASLVCRSWYEATLDPIFLQKTRCIFDASLLDDENSLRADKQILLGCLIKSPNIYVVNLDENFNARTFLKLHRCGMNVLGSHVEHLSLKNSNILEGTLVQLLQFCPNLKSLDLSGCNALFMSGIAFTNSLRTDVAKKCLQNVTALSLSSSRFLNDTILCRLYDICPSIASINLSSNNLICNSLGISKRNSLTFLVVAQLFSLNANLIKKIDFSRTSIVSDSLSMLAITKNLNLHTVILQNCRELTDKGVIKLVLHQKNITILDLSECSEIGNASVNAVCDNLVDLQTLKLRKCVKITSDSVKNLSKLKELVELDISECHEVNMAGLQRGLGGMEKLRILKLKCCNLSRFSESFFLPLQSSIKENETRIDIPCPSILSLSLTYALQHLDIGSSQYVDDVAVQAVSTYLVNLRVLKLAWSPSITDRGLLGLSPESSVFAEKEPSSDEEKLAQFFTGRKYSNSHGHSGLIQKPGSEFRLEKLEVDDTVLQESLEKKGLVRLKKLRQLTLANCKKLSPLALYHIFSYKRIGFPQLEELDLGMLSQAVNDVVIKTLSSSTQLRSLSLAFCSMITDEGMQCLLKKLRFLEKLDISSCDGLTQSSLQDLPRLCHWLKELNVSMCRRIPPSFVEDLKDKIPSLLRIHSRFVGGESLDKTL